MNATLCIHCGTPLSDKHPKPTACDRCRDLLLLCQDCAYDTPAWGDRCQQCQRLAGRPDLWMRKAKP